MLAQGTPDGGGPEALVLATLPLASALEGPVAWPAVALLLSPPAGRRPPPVPAYVSRRGATPRDGGYRVDHLEEVGARDGVLPRHRRPSWLIDHDQPAFRPVLDAARAALGPRPTATALTAFAAGYLTTKSYTRGFDLASQVARSRTGDCTEHAVLLAGLLRAFGIPARGVLGVLLTPGPDRPRAFGHMWVEAWVDGRWTVADAAISEPGVVRLPVGEVEDEGPGFTLGLVRPTEALGWRLELVPASP